MKYGLKKKKLDACCRQISLHYTLGDAFSEIKTALFQKVLHAGC